MSNDAPGIAVLSVNCNHCGAPLQVQPATRFVTCGHCGSKLEIHRTGSAAYSEVLDEIRSDTRSIAGDVEAIRLQNELERIDREWTMQLDHYKTTDKNGQQRLPNSAGGTIFGMAFTVIFGVAFMAFPALAGAPSEMVGFATVGGLLFIAFGVGAGLFALNKGSQYEDAFTDYQARRDKLLSEIETRRK